MLRFEQLAGKPIVLQQLTGLSRQAFADLLPAFHQASISIEAQLEQQRSQPRQRQKGGGRKALLRSDADRLLFILVYFKIYPFKPCTPSCLV